MVALSSLGVSAKESSVRSAETPGISGEATRARTKEPCFGGFISTAMSFSETIRARCATVLRVRETGGVSGEATVSSEAARGERAGTTSTIAGVGATSAPRCKPPISEATRTAFRSAERLPCEGRGERATSRNYGVTERLRSTARPVGAAGGGKAVPSGELVVRGFRQRETFSRKVPNAAGLAISGSQQTETKGTACCGTASEGGRTAAETRAREVC